MARPIKLSDRQVAVLRWIGEGCPGRDWPDESHKNTARALASRGLVEVGRKRKVWTATITSAEEYYHEHSRPEPLREVGFETGGDAVLAAPRLVRGQRRTDHPSLDVTSGAMRGVASRRRPTVVKQSQREIKEMRLFSAAGRLAVSGRRVVLHLARTNEWAGLLVAMLARLRALPAPAADRRLPRPDPRDTPATWNPGAHRATSADLSHPEAESPSPRPPHGRPGNIGRLTKDPG